MKETARRPRRRWRRVLAFTLGALLLIPLLLVALFLLQPVRDRLLREGLRRADAALPGTLRVDRSAWPGPQTVELAGLLWTLEEDTLVALRRGRLKIDLPALVRKDVRVKELRLEGLAADAGAMQRAFPPSPDAAPGDTAGAPAFPREGSLAGVPSLAVEAFHVDASRIRLPDGTALGNVLAEGAVELGRGAAPGVRVDTLRAVQSPAGRRVEAVRLAADLAAWTLSGAIRGEPAPGVALQVDLVALEPGRTGIRVLESPRPAAAGQAGLELTVRLKGSDPYPGSVDFDGLLRIPGTAELRERSVLRESLAGVPDLEAVTLHLEGTAAWDGEPAARALLYTDPNAWLDGLRLRGSYGPAGIALDTLAVAMPGLSLDASGAVRDSTLQAEALLRVSGTEWLRPFVDAALPESLAAGLRLEADGPLRAPRIRAALDGGFRTGSLVVDRVTLDAAGVAPEGPLDAQLAVELRGHRATLRAEALRRGTALEARLSPLHIAELPAAAASGPRERTGTVRFDPSGSGLAADNLRITGSLGELAVSAALDTLRRGSFRLRGDWPAAPSLLLATLAEADSTRDALQRLWKEDPAPQLSAEGTFDLGASPPRIEARGSARLPGPRGAAPLLPPQVIVDDLGPLEITFDLTSDATGWKGIVSLEETPWLDAGRILAHGDSAGIVLDTVAVVVEGLDLTARGSLLGDAVDLESTFALEGDRILRRAMATVPDSLTLSARGSVTASGTTGRLRVAADATGDVLLPALAVRGVDAVARYDAGRLEALVEVGAGARFGTLRFDALRADFASQGDTLLPGRLRLDAEGDVLAGGISLVVATQPFPAVDCDTLDLEVLGRSVVAREPFRVEIRREEERIAVDGLDLAGDLGTIRADGVVGRGETAMTVAADLSVPEELLGDDVPAGLRPSAVSLSVQSTGVDSVTLEGDVQGIRLPGRRNVAVLLEAETGRGAARVRLELTESGDSLLVASATLPLTLTVYPFSATFTGEPSEIDAVIAGLPVPTRVSRSARGSELDDPVLLDGRIALRGGGDAPPEGRADLTATFPSWPRLETYRMEFEASLNDSGTRANAAGEGGGTGSVAASLRVLRRQNALLTGDLALSGLRLPESPPHVDLEGGTLDLQLRGDKVVLDDLSPLLPAGVSIGGTCSLRLDAKGAVEDPDLAGNFRMDGVTVRLADGTRATASSRLRFGGSARRPAVEGRIEVEQGLLRIPDPPRALLPVEGESRLWELSGGAPWERAAAEDSVSRKGDRKPEVQADLDVAVVIPGAFWIRGRGLSVELAGDLRVVQKGTEPTVTGELEAVRGTLDLLGRQLQVERGLVSFYGDDEINPSLDIRVTTRIKEIGGAGGTYQVAVEVRGTAQEPEIVMTSEPELTEGDIMSLMLFGKTAEGLETGESGFLQQRAADIAQTFAASELGARLSQELGVDMIAIQEGEREDEASRLVVGKYLTRRALLKYEQALESTVNVFINLEYLLTRHLKLETLYGVRSQSGAQITWSSEY